MKTGGGTTGVERQKWGAVGEKKCRRINKPIINAATTPTYILIKRCKHRGREISF